MTIHFIGAGPGAADLITVRGRDLLARCPVCLFAGSLVPTELLAHCPSNARIIDTAPMTLDQIEAEFVKLDRSIVTTAPTEPGARAVLMAMATFARQTGAFVIAEGIEDEDTLEFLRRVNERDQSLTAIIQGGQGYGLGRPSPDLSPESPALLQDSQVIPLVK